MLAALRVPACDGLEFDVRVSRDDVPVLLHDATLRRVQHRPERVGELTAEELAGDEIPALDEVLAAVPVDVFLDAEVKVDPGPMFVPILERHRGADGRLTNAVVSSFDVAALDRIGRERPDWGRWLNAKSLDESVLRLACDLGCAAVSVEWHAIDERSVGRARVAGLDVAAWTVRGGSTFDRLASLGVVAVCVEGAALDG
jgi:glycerophosphoryl diester phosphodiesterase